MFATTPTDSLSRYCDGSDTCRCGGCVRVGSQLEAELAESRAVSRIVACYREVAYGHAGTTVAAWVEAAADELLQLEATSERRRELLEDAEAILVSERWHPEMVGVFTHGVAVEADL